MLIKLIKVLPQVPQALYIEMRIQSFNASADKHQTTKSNNSV